MSFARMHPTLSEDFATVAALRRAAFEIDGTSGNDRLHGNPGGNDFDLSQGGDDSVNGKGGDDTVYFGAAFTGADRVNGGQGIDIVTLDGDYSAGIDVQADSLVKIESLVLEGGSYVITGELGFKNDLGETFVDGRGLAADQSLHIKVSALGDLALFGGAGDDVLDGSVQPSGRTTYLVGGNGDDTLIGGAGETYLLSGFGADHLSSDSDQTRFQYGDTRESDRAGVDTIERFQGKIWLLFDSDTATAGVQHDFHFGKTADWTGDILVKYDAGSDETIVKVFTDADHKADFVLHLTGDVPLTAADFIFG